MALQRVDLVDYSRNLLQEDDVCPMCLENLKEDQGKFWVAHHDVTNPDPAKNNQLIHPIHRDCVKLTFEISKLCLSRDVELNLPLTQEEINAKRLEDLKAERMGRIANFGEKLAKVTEKIVILVGMIGIFLLINNAFPEEIGPGHIILATSLISFGLLDRMEPISLKELTCLQILTIIIAGIKLAITHPPLKENFTASAFALGPTGAIAARKVGIFTGKLVRNGVNLLGNRLMR